MHPIEIHGLTKAFGKARALDGLELTVREGEVHGFLGPNGAGKSTTIRILLGVVKADGGTVRLLGGDPWADAVDLHRHLAYVPGDVTLWPNLTGGETIDLLARMRGGIDDKRRAELIERFELDPHKKARTYSKGNRQKVSLISAFSSRARLLLLDEPSSGLDPLMENIFQQCVAEARDRGATVLLSSHVLEEVAGTCDRVVVVDRGRCVEAGRLDGLLAGRIRLRSPDAAALLAKLQERGLQAAPDGPGTILVEAADPDAVGRAARDAGAVLHEMSTQGALEELYVGLTEAG